VAVDAFESMAITHVFGLLTATSKIKDTDWGLPTEAVTSILE
jgi:hypothetical protein